MAGFTPTPIGPTPTPTPIPELGNLGLLTFAVNKYTDSAYIPNGLPADCEKQLKMSIRKVVNGAEVDTAVHPLYDDRLCKFHIESGRGDNADILELEYDDYDGQVSSDGHFTKGAAVSVAFDYTYQGDTYTSCVGVYFIQTVSRKDRILTVTADNLITILRGQSVKGLTITCSQSSTDPTYYLTEAVSTMLHNAGIPVSSTGFRRGHLSASVTLPDMDLWQMLRYLNNKVAGFVNGGVGGSSYYYSVKIGRDGKLTFKQEYTAVSFSEGESNPNLINELMYINSNNSISDAEVSESAPYNNVIMMYSSADGYVRKYDNGSNASYTIDNPFDTALTDVNADEWRVPKGLVSDIYHIEAVLPLPYFFEVGSPIRVNGLDMDDYYCGTVLSMSVDYDGVLYASVDFAFNDPVTVASTGSVSITAEDKLGSQGKYISEVSTEIAEDESQYYSSNTDRTIGNLLWIDLHNKDADINKPARALYGQHSNGPSDFAQGFRTVCWHGDSFVTVTLVGQDFQSGTGIWINGYNANAGGWLGWKRIATTNQIPSVPSKMIVNITNYNAYRVWVNRTGIKVYGYITGKRYYYNDGTSVLDLDMSLAMEGTSSTEWNLIKPSEIMSGFGITNTITGYKDGIWQEFGSSGQMDVSMVGYGASTNINIQNDWIQLGRYYTAAGSYGGWQASMFINKKVQIHGVSFYLSA